MAILFTKGLKKTKKIEKNEIFANIVSVNIGGLL